MDKLITVVIPTYNIEKYIKDCLASLAIEEIADRLEVLIINDGSKDRSADIGREYEKKYPDIFRVIDKENGGHGSTINRGINEARGKYFKVVDGDDWVAKKAFIKLTDFLLESDCDMAVTNFYWIDNKSGKRTIEFDKPFSSCEFGKQYKFEELPDDAYFKMHGITVKTEILRKIPAIDEHCFYVDMEYMLFPIPFVKTLVCLDEYVYMYRIGLPTQSMNITKMQKNEENFDRVLERLFKYYDKLKAEKTPDCYISYFRNILGRAVSSRFKIFLSFPLSRETKERIASFDAKLLESYPDIHGSVKNKAVLLLRKSSFRLYPLAHAAFMLKERMN